MKKIYPYNQRKGVIMKQKISKATKGLVLSTALYSSMSFAYRLDKNIELSYVNYSFISDALTDILNGKSSNIKFAYKNNENKKNNYFSSNMDETVVIYNVEKSNFENLNVCKKGNSFSIYNSGVIGNNSAILSEENINLKNGTIKTFGIGAKGFYQKNKNKKAIMENFIIETMQKNSNAIEVSDQSKVKIYNVYIYTNDDCSGGLCVSANSELNAEKTTVYTAGKSSPGLYINGILTIKNGLVETSSSYVAVLEGNSNFISINTSLRGYKGIKISNDENSEFYSEQKIGIIGRYLNVNKGWAITGENSNVIINLLNSNITSRENKLINLKNLNNNNKKNYSKIILKNSNINGEIKTDQYNFLKIVMNDKSYISGKINGNVELDFDDNAHSYFNMSGNSFLSKIKIKDEKITTLRKFIFLNGNTLYYDREENLWLNGKTYYFEDGSVIKPKPGGEL